MPLEISNDSFVRVCRLFSRDFMATSDDFVIERDFLISKWRDLVTISNGNEYKNKHVEIWKWGSDACDRMRTHDHQYHRQHWFLIFVCEVNKNIYNLVSQFKMQGHISLRTVVFFFYYFHAHEIQNAIKWKHSMDYMAKQHVVLFECHPLSSYRFVTHMFKPLHVAYFAIRNDKIMFVFFNDCNRKCLNEFRRWHFLFVCAKFVDICFRQKKNQITIAEMYLNIVSNSHTLRIGSVHFDVQ